MVSYHNVSLIVGVSVVCLGVPLEGLAQRVATSFVELAGSTTPGDLVYVIDSAQEETKGRLVTLSATSLQLILDGSRRDFTEGAVARVERHDSARNGLLVGLGSGAVLGFFQGRKADSSVCNPGIECGQGAVLGVLGGALVGAVIGWAIDNSNQRREVVYRSPGEP